MYRAEAPSIETWIRFASKFCSFNNHEGFSTINDTKVVIKSANKARNEDHFGWQETTILALDQVEGQLEQSALLGWPFWKTELRLSYVEDNPLIPVLTPNSLLFGQPNLLPGLEHHNWRPQICKSMQSNSRDASMLCESDGQTNTLSHYMYASNIDSNTQGSL